MKKLKLSVVLVVGIFFALNSGVFAISVCPGVETCQTQQICTDELAGTYTPNSACGTGKGCCKTGAAITPLPDNSDELVADYECTAAKLFDNTSASSGASIGYATFAKTCNKTCPRKCLYKSPEYTIRINGYCWGVDNACETYTGDLALYKQLESVNFLGIDIDRSLLILVRRVMLLAFGAAGLIIIGFGIVAMYKFSFSEGNQEKVQEAIKIFKSLIFGSIIVFAGLTVVQILAAFTGVTGSLVDFNFLPRSGRFVYLYEDDLGKPCLPEQMPLADYGAMQYTCDETTLTWKL